MRCRRCAAAAVVELRRHNAAYCKDCFLHVVRGQVVKAIDEHHMLEAGDRILVAVSGGKDSLALWDVLLDLGYDATGLYLGLGIGEYSVRSRDVAATFSSDRGAELLVVDLERELADEVLPAEIYGGVGGDAG